MFGLLQVIIHLEQEPLEGDGRGSYHVLGQQIRDWMRKFVHETSIHERRKTKQTLR